MLTSDIVHILLSEPNVSIAIVSTISVCVYGAASISVFSLGRPMPEQN